MELLSIDEIRQITARSWKKILLIAAAVTLVAVPLLFLAIPKHYQLETTLVVPYRAVEPEAVMVRMKGDVLETVYRELDLASAGMSLSRVGRNLSVASSKDQKLIFAGFVGRDPELVSRFMHRLNIEALYVARDLQIEHYREEIAELEERNAVIEGMFTDDFVIRYYEYQYASWLEYIETAATGSSIFLEVDPLLGELYLELKDNTHDINTRNNLIEGFEELTDSDMLDQFSPHYAPDLPATPNPLMLIPASAVLGLLAGFFWVLAGHYGPRGSGRNKRQESAG